MISRNQKELSEKDIAKISGTYHNWRKASETGFSGLKDGQDLNNLNPANQEIQKSSSDYVYIPSFCKSATIEDIRKNNHILTIGRYIDFKEVAKYGIAFNEKMQTLTAKLSAQMQKANELDEAIKLNLSKIGIEI